MKVSSSPSRFPVSFGSRLVSSFKLYVIVDFKVHLAGPVLNHFEILLVPSLKCVGRLKGLLRNPCIYTPDYIFAEFPYFS